MHRLTGEDRERIAGKRVIASISGGKDSAALSLWLTEQGIEHDRVFLDTGWEHEDTYAYLRGPLAAKIGPIAEVRGAFDMEGLIRKKGMFPSRKIRWCTEELKQKPMQRHLRALMDGGADVVNAVGIRADESAARAKQTRWEWSEGFDCDVWRPLISWTVQDVIDIHQRHGLAPNPLYLRGAQRVGCWPCVNSRKSEIRMIAETDPARIAKIRDLEGIVTVAQMLRKGARGEELENAPAWFQAPVGRDGACWPIDRVVEWSRTVRGGRDEDKQETLFSGMNDGCMRWGLCESHPPTRENP